jgi:membrane associated rhomboid family serine protease
VIPVKDNIPTERLPLVTIGLILANVVVYLLAFVHGGGFFSGPDVHQVVRYGAIPRALTHGLGQHCTLVGSVLACGKRAGPGTLAAWQTAFTSMFMHGSIVHLAANMLVLWIFGNNVEDAMGHVKYLAFYVVGGLVALALQVAVSPNSTVPTIGAAGGIAAVLGAYVVLYPRARVLALTVLILFVTVLEIPVLLVIGLWVVLQAVFAATHLITPTGPAGVEAYFAYVGGLVFGLVMVRLLATRAKRVPPAVLAH